MTLVDEASTKPTKPVTETLIDTDVHQVLVDRELLLPYMRPEWRQYYKDYSVQVNTSVPSDASYATPQPSSRLDWKGTEVHPGANVDILREQLLDGEGIDIAILNGFLYPSAMVTGFDYARDLAAACNLWQLEEWLAPEPRLRGSIQVVVEDAEQAVSEIERFSKHDDLVQLFLPSVTDRSYGDPQYRPIFKAALDHGLPVTIHHHMFTRTVLGNGYPRHYSEWHTLAAPHAAQAQMVSMIFGGLFERYPDLKVVYLEIGAAWLPWFMERMDENYREFRIETPWLKKLPSEYMRDHIRLSTQPMTDMSTQDFVEMVKKTGTEDMFMFSTDYPHFDSDSADAVLPRNVVPTDLWEKIRYRNALDTFPRLKLPAP